MKVRFVLAAVAVAVSTPGFAQEVYDEPVTSAGGHIAVVAGYDGTMASASTGSDTLDGVAYGVKLGYDFNVIDHGLLGVEVELNQSTAKFDNGLGDTLKMGRDLYAGVRLKVDVSETIALYVKGGYTNASLTATTGGAAASATMDGWRVGAGAEIKLGGPFMGLVEYRYSNYGTYGLGFATPVKIERHQAVAGAGYRF